MMVAESFEIDFGEVVQLDQLGFQIKPDLQGQQALQGQPGFQEQQASQGQQGFQGTPGFQGQPGLPEAGIKRHVKVFSSIINPSAILKQEWCIQPRNA